MIHICRAIPSNRCWGGSRTGTTDELRHVLDWTCRSCQYGHYLWQLGRAILAVLQVSQSPVRQIILERYPATLQLLSWLWLCARRSPFRQGMARCAPPRAYDDRAVGVFTLFGLAFPDFAFGTVLILLFRLNLGSCSFGRVAAYTCCPRNVGRRAGCNSHSHGSRLHA